MKSICYNICEKTEGAGIMKTKGVLFDKDGTLIDFDSFWTEIAVHAVDYLLTNLHINPSLRGGALYAIGVRESGTDVDGVLCKGTYGDIAEVLQAYFLKKGVEIPLQSVYEATVDGFHKNADKGKIAPTCENIRGVLSDLKEKGLKLGVMTSDDAHITETCLKGLQIEDLFDVIYTDDGTHPNKPDPFCIRAFCETFGLSKDEVVMVGDSLTDITFAHNGDIKAVAVAKTKENVDFLTGKAAIVVPDISYLKDVLV